MFARALPLVVSFLVTLSSASPGIAGYQRSPGPCHHPNQTSFTLVSEYTSLGGAGFEPILALVMSSNNQSIAWIGVADTNSTDAIPISQNFVMVEGGITATTSNGSITGVSKSVSTTNGLLEFVPVSGLLTPEPVENVYCEMLGEYSVSSALNYTLAVNGYISRFSLCQRTGGNDFALIYNAVGKNITVGEYQFGNCNKVRVHVDAVKN